VVDRQNVLKRILPRLLAGTASVLEHALVYAARRDTMLGIEIRFLLDAGRDRVRARPPFLRDEVNVLLSRGGFVGQTVNLRSIVPLVAANEATIARGICAGRFTLAEAGE